MLKLTYLLKNEIYLIVNQYHLKSIYVCAYKMPTILYIQYMYMYIISCPGFSIQYFNSFHGENKERRILGLEVQEFAGC